MSHSRPGSEARLFGPRGVSAARSLPPSQPPGIRAWLKPTLSSVQFHPASDFFEPKGIKMRNLILVAAISLATATVANAGPSRSLSLAANETEQPVSEQPQTEQKADAPPGAVERPKLVVPQEQTKPPLVADKPAEPAKPKKKRSSTQARVIYELHRHGIYW